MHNKFVSFRGACGVFILGVPLEPLPALPRQSREPSLVRNGTQYSLLSLVRPPPPPLFFNFLNANLLKGILHYRNVYFDDYRIHRQWK